MEIIGHPLANSTIHRALGSLIRTQLIENIWLLLYTAARHQIARGKSRAISCHIYSLVKN